MHSNGPETPLHSILFGLLFAALGILFFLFPPEPGKAMGGRMGNLQGPPIVFTRIMASGATIFGLYFVFKGFKDARED